MTWRASEIAERIGGEVEGDSAIELERFSTIEDARAGDLVLAETEAYFQQAEKSGASGLLVPANLKCRSTKVLIRVSNARVALAKAIPLFFSEPEFPAGVDPSAHVAPEAEVAESAHIGPGCVIEADTTIGPHTVLQGRNHIGRGSRIGESARLFPGVVLYPKTVVGDRCRIHANAVIGSDGFGYVYDGERHLKVPQVGSVRLGEDVEVGANVTIDRGTLGATVVGRGTKIDNLVHIAHNVTIGKNCVIVAQVGIAGSTELGDFVTLAGQVGLAGHIKIEDGATIAAQAGVKDRVGPGETWWGSPARPIQQIKRQIVAQQQLPDLVKRVSRLEQQMKEMPETSGPSAS